MGYQFQTIKITEGNAFALLLPLKQRTFESCKPIDEDIDATLLEDVVVTIGDAIYTASLGMDGVTVALPSNLARGVYDIVLTATYQGVGIRAAYQSAFEIVKWSQQSNAEQYIIGSPITCNAAYVIASLTDSELENLKQTYAQKIAEAEQAREEYEQAAAELQGVAQESTSQAILQEVQNIDIDTTELAKQGTNAAATNTAILEAIGSIAADQSAVAECYEILEEKGVEIPSQPSDLTAANLPSTISQINEAFVGEAYCASLGVSNDPLYTDMNFAGVVVTGTSLQGAFLSKLYLTRVRGLRSTTALTSIYAIFESTYCDEIDLSTLTTSSVTNAGRIFFRTSVKRIDMHDLDFTSATSFSQMFYSANQVEWIDFSGIKISANLTDWTMWASGTLGAVTTLVGDHTIDEVIDGNICVFEGLAVTTGSGDNGFAKFSNINRASLRALINGLADMSGGTAQTLYIGATNIAKLEAEDTQIATDKNWTLA